MGERARVKVIGHRGAAGLEPENTLLSYRRAIELGVDAIECDVRLTRDERIVLLHDAALDRTTDGCGPVSAMTFDEVRALDAGKGEKVPTLGELLALAGGRVELVVELKDGAAGASVLRDVAAAGAGEWAVVTSFDTDLLARVRAMDAAIRVEHIFSDPPADALDRAAAVGAARVSANFAHLTERFVAASHERGLEVIAWPPHTVADQRHAMALGVDLVCTDRPDVLIELLAGGEGGGSSRA